MLQRILTQKEIDELFERYAEQPIKEEVTKYLTMQELDTIGEIGNICMGTAATTLSDLLNHRVTIGYPKTIVCPQEEVFKSFVTPYLIMKVEFKSGLNGFNVFVVTEEDVAVIADIMMGGVGDVKKPITITEMELSAATEVMNQMIGTAATAMAEMFGVPIDISPPDTTMVEDLRKASLAPLPTDKPVVVARFEATIGNLIKTTFMQITNVHAAREEAHFLMMQVGIFDEPENVTTDTGSSISSAPASALGLGEFPNLTGALAVPMEMVFSLGSYNCTVGDLAKMSIGDEINLTQPPGQVEILVNRLPVARGEVKVKGQQRYIKIQQIYKLGQK